jgi:hypothetical protein
MNNDEIFHKIKYYLESNDKYDNHVLPQYLYLISNDNIIDNNIIIMKTETLIDDMIKNGFDDFNLNINVTYRNKIDYIKLLNHDAIKLINEFYKKDFEYFGYEMII